MNFPTIRQMDSFKQIQQFFQLHLCICRQKNIEEIYLPKGEMEKLICCKIMVVFSHVQ